MFKSLDKEIKIKRFFWTTSSVFSFNMFFGLALRAFLIDPLIVKSGSIAFRAKEEVLLFWVWNIFGHVLYSIFGTYAYISWADEKDFSEGIKSGILLGFLPASFLLTISPYIEFTTPVLWGMVFGIFLVTSINGVLALKIYNWKYLNSNTKF